MVQEIYSSNKRSFQKHMSPSEVRKLKKKALQSYGKIDTIKQNSMKEKKKATAEAEEILEQFIISGNKKNG